MRCQARPKESKMSTTELPRQAQERPRGWPRPQEVPTVTKPSSRSVRLAIVLSAVLVGYVLAYLFPMAPQAHAAQPISATATLRPNSVISLSSGAAGWLTFSGAAASAQDIADDNPKTGLSAGAAVSSHYSLQVGFAPFTFPAGASISSVTLRATESCAYNPQFYAFLLGSSGALSSMATTPPAYQFMPPGRLDTYSPSWTPSVADVSSPRVQVNLDTGPADSGQASINEMYLDVAYTYTPAPTPAPIPIPTCCVPGGPLPVAPIPPPAPAPVPAPKPSIPATPLPVAKVPSAPVLALAPKPAPAAVPVAAQVRPAVPPAPPSPAVPSPAPLVPSATPSPIPSASPSLDATPIVDALAAASSPVAAPVRKAPAHGGSPLPALIGVAVVLGLLSVVVVRLKGRDPLGAYVPRDENKEDPEC